MAKQRNPKGLGSYKKRTKDNKVWYEWVRTIDGKPQYLTGKTPSELQEKIKRISNIVVRSTKATVAEWFISWLATYIKPLKKDATYEQYRILYEQHIEPVIGHRKINNVKRHDIQGVIAKANEKDLSSATMKHIRKVMSIGFKKALKEGLVSVNPVNEVEIPKKQPKPMRILSIQELNKIFKVMENSRWKWAIQLMLVTGLRRGEILALKWTDIDFINKQIMIERSDSKAGEGDTKSSKVHYIPLSVNALKYLNGQKNQLEKEKNPILYNEELKKTPLVFPGKEGVMIRADSFYTMLSRFATKAGIKANPHCLRHTFVFLTRDTMMLKELQYTLGHDKSTTTLDLYGDILDNSTVKTANKIDEVFDKVNEEIKAEAEKEKKKKEKCKIIQFPQVR